MSLHGARLVDIGEDDPAEDGAQGIGILGHQDHADGRLAWPGVTAGDLVHALFSLSGPDQEPGGASWYPRHPVVEVPRPWHESHLSDKPPGRDERRGVIASGGRP